MNDSRPEEAGQFRQPMPAALAAKLRAAQASRAMQGERRVITMLFCDVTGSTAMAEQMDPEEWAEVMSEAFDFMIAPVFRYEGTLVRLMGDAILAFFGAPIAHEDDPQRAILAGLDIVSGIGQFKREIERDYGLAFDVRVGINTGPVVVGELGSDLALEYTAMGDAINVAARMEQAAEPGTVQIAEATYRLVAPLFEVEARGKIGLKGKEEPLAAYLVRGRKERPGRLRGIAGISAPLVGRDEELQKLQRALGDLRQGQGGIVCLIGEAGLGKSRLIEEIQGEWTTQYPESRAWLEGRGVSYDAQRPYGVFRQLMRSSLGIHEEDPPDVVQQKMMQSAPSDPAYRARYQELVEVVAVLTADDGAEVMPSGEALKQRLHEGAAAMWRYTASFGPLVMMYDDLHWADPASVEMLLHLLSLAREAPVLFLCAMRPHRDAPGWEITRRAAAEFADLYTEINLQPLSESGTTDLVDNLLPIAGAPATVRQEILQKADGNPLFVEEFVRELIDSGLVVRAESGLTWRPGAASLASLDIPDNLQGLLVARIDRLEKATRTTLQLAAVIGRTFYQRVLAQLAEAAANLDAHLEALLQAEMILQLASSQEVSYMFRHELTRDAAYRSILRRSRRRYHRQVAEVVEKLFAHRLAEEAHVLAYHFDEALDREQALKYYTLAGDRAAMLYANSEAASHYRRAVEIATGAQSPAGGTQVETLYTRLGRALELSGRFEEALAGYRQMESLGRERGELALELAALLAQATVYVTPTSEIDPSAGRKLAGEALALARELGAEQAEAKALWNLLLAELFDLDGDTAEGIANGEHALAIARRLELREELAYILHDLARAYMRVGRLDDTFTAQSEARQLWRQSGNKNMLADSLTATAEGLYQQGRYEEAIDAGNRGLQISEEINSLWGQSYALGVLGLLYLELGRIDEGMAALDRAAHLAKQANFSGQEVNALYLVWARASLGDIDYGRQALERFRESVQVTVSVPLVREVVDAVAAWLYAAEGKVDIAWQVIQELEEKLPDLAGLAEVGPLLAVTVAEVALAAGHGQKALEIVAGSIAKLEGEDTVLFLGDLYRVRGLALRQLGQDEAAYEALRLARAAAQGSRRASWPILVVLAAVEAERGAAAEATKLRQEAQEIVTFIVDHIGDMALRASFLQGPAVQAARAS